MKKTSFLIFMIIFFKIKTAETPEYINIWVAWDVGQGQWVTHILPDECHHFDIGGEPGSFKNVKKKLIYFCNKKMNKLSLSHWDYDHFMNIPLLSRTLPNICWENKPIYFNSKKTAQKILDLQISACSQKTRDLNIWTPSTSKTSNESSLIFYSSYVLMTGDSPVQQEKIWASEFKSIPSTKVLILGHHGSRTSTGKFLLENLKSLNFSIASARYQKYKHPHREALSRLAEFNIPVLKTEDWGNIWFF